MILFWKQSDEILPSDILRAIWYQDAVSATEALRSSISSSEERMNEAEIRNQ